jgi:hypothetical protein
MENIRLISLLIGALGTIFFAALAVFSYLSPTRNPWILAILLTLTAAFLIVTIFGSRLREITVSGSRVSIKFFTAEEMEGGTSSDEEPTYESTTQVDSSETGLQPSRNPEETSSSDSQFENLIEIARTESTDLADILSEIRRQSMDDDSFEALLSVLEKALITSSDHLDEVITELDRQIAIKRYRNQARDPTMDIVGYTGNRIQAQANQQERLTKGIRFDILLDHPDIDEDQAIGTARMTEPNSNTGRLYELEVEELRGESVDVLEDAEGRLLRDSGTIRVQELGVTEMDIRRLEQMRDALIELKNEDREREVEYAT